MRKSFIALALLAATSAQAGLVSYSGSIDQGLTAPDNDFAAGIPVLFGREVSIDGPATIKMTALFSEAAYTNAFITVGDITFSDDIDGDAYSFEFDGGLLPSSFYVTNTNRGVINGGNQSNWESKELLPYFAVTPVEQQLGFETFIIGLNDNSTSDVNPDLDLDDMIIQVDVVPGGQVDVPEPAPAAMLGLGLIGVGLSRLKARRTK